MCQRTTILFLSREGALWDEPRRNETYLSRRDPIRRGEAAVVVVAPMLAEDRVEDCPTEIRPLPAPSSPSKDPTHPKRPSW